ncbi:type II CAAX endopeptidase family protein [Methylocapsa polymorpha]|uniref:Type II CAAX endopeptidase family protein n=1 Tax=Methylocapsa polymorpha TaxID=3080828 RepID=A0ABZ0HR81_9HYPH|nr:type II CAAX endopeptidase family protein [Methylocapsa sp. RX1]
MAELAQKTIKSKAYAIFELCLSLIVIVGVAIILFLLTVMLAAVADAILAHWPLSRPLEERVRSAISNRNSEALTYLGLAASSLTYLAVGLAVLLVARLRGGADWLDLVAWRPWVSWLRRRSFWLLVGATLAYSFAADFAIAYFSPDTRNWLTTPKDGAGAALLALLAVVFAPVTEELVFRGWIFTNLRRDFSFVTTVLISSAVFAGMHYDSTHVYALAVFPVGLALGALRELTGSVKSSIALHALNNFIAVCLSFPD